MSGDLKLMGLFRQMLSSLKEAETFIGKELETRKDSFLPGPNGEDSEYIDDAGYVLSKLRAAIAKAEGRA